MVSFFVPGAVINAAGAPRLANTCSVSFPGADAYVPDVACVPVCSPGEATCPAASCRQITAGNAEALGWNDAGRLAAGASADVLVIEPDIRWLESSVAPLDMLLWAWDDRWIKRTVVRGRVGYETV